MITAFDKVFAALLPGLVLFLNQKFGWHLDTDPATLTALATALSAILVYFIPNKQPTSPADGAK